MHSAPRCPIDLCPACKSGARLSDEDSNPRGGSRDKNVEEGFASVKLLIAPKFDRKLVKSMLDFPITTDARLTVIPAFARRSPFWISDIHCRHTLSDVEGRRDSFQLELERLFDREEPSNANSVDFSIVEYTSGERLSSFNSDFFPFLFLFPFSLSYSSFTQRGKCYVIFCQFCFRNDSTISINCVVTRMFNGCLDWRRRKSRKWNSIGENTGRNNSELSSSFLRNIRCG